MGYGEVFIRLFYRTTGPTSVQHLTKECYLSLSRETHLQTIFEVENPRAAICPVLAFSLRR
jgi:hypothetical protein